jgi:hypothetical protein
MAEEKVRFENGQNVFFAKVYGKELSMRYPIALHQLALMEYSPKWTIDMIVLFEKMVVFYRSRHLLPFQYQQRRLRNELHLTTDRLNKAREDLKKLDILKEDNPGRGKKIKFSIDRDKVIELLPLIYVMPDNDQKRKTMIDDLRNFYTYYLSKQHEYATKMGIEHKRVDITGGK